MENEVQGRTPTKMSNAFREGRELDLINLWSEIGGSTRFGIDKVLSMASLCHDNEEDFLVNHSGTHYRVPFEALNEYFKTHRKPEIKMNMRQENIRLKKQIDDLEGLIESLSSGGEVSIPKQRNKGNAEADFMHSFQSRAEGSVPPEIESKIKQTMGELDPDKMKADLRAQEVAGVIEEGPTPEEIALAKIKGPVTPEEAERYAKETLRKAKPLTHPL